MKAFIFDLNGTMIDDMRYHAKAWELLLNNELGGNFTPAQVKEQMYGKNPEANSLPLLASTITERTESVP